MPVYSNRFKVEVIDGNAALSRQYTEIMATVADAEAAASASAADAADAAASAEAAALAAGFIFDTRASLAAAADDIADGQIVSVRGIYAVKDDAATGTLSALHGLGVNGIRIVGDEIDADFWLGDAGSADDKSALIQECFDYSLAHRQAQGGNGRTVTILRGRHWVETELSFGGSSSMNLDARDAILMARTGGTLFDVSSTVEASKYVLSIVNTGQSRHYTPYIICNHGCNGIYLSNSFNTIYHCQRVLYYLWRGLLIDRVIGKNAGSVIYDLTGDEWGTGEYEFNFEASYKAIGLYVNTNDIRVVNAHIGYSKYAIWNGPEGFGVEYINCHPYAGNPNVGGGTAPVGAEKRIHPRVFVNQCSGVVNCYDCYFDGGYVDDQTGTLNIHGGWGVPSEWTDWASADSILTKPIVRIRKQTTVTNMTGYMRDCAMSAGFYTGNWNADGVFTSPSDLIQDATATGGRGRINEWAQRVTRFVFDFGNDVVSKVIRQGGTGAVIRHEYQPGTGELVWWDAVSGAFKFRRNSGGGRIDVNSDKTGMDCTGTDLRFFVADASRVVIQTNGIMRPSGDNTQNLGNASFRWGTVYAGTGTINTSDEREKQDVRDISDAERAVAVSLKALFRAYRFKDAVALKGDAARIHFGVMAQDVAAAFEAEGLDPFRYGIICCDEWPAELDDDGNIVTPAGNRWGVRYDELLAFIVAALA